MHKIKRQRALLDKIVHTHQIFPGLRKVRKTYKHILPLHLDSSSFVVIPQVTTVFFVIRMNSGVHEFDKTTEPPPQKNHIISHSSVTALLTLPLTQTYIVINSGLIKYE